MKKDIIIGFREVMKNKDKIEKILVAKNCPEEIIQEINSNKDKLNIENFDGDQKELGTKIGKPFPVAVVGFLKKSDV